MENLKVLYAKRQVFLEYGKPIPQELVEQIRQAESDIIGGIADTIISYLPEEIQMPANCNLVVGVEYCDGKLVKTASLLNKPLEKLFDQVKDIQDNFEEDLNEDYPDGPQRTRGTGFKVKFSDDRIIYYSTAQRTMIEALRYMGLDRASKYRDETFANYPLIGKEKRRANNRIWQKYVDGWWIYINLTNDRKIACLKGVAKMLNIPIEIIPIEAGEEYTYQNEIDSRRALYSLNGGTALHKNRSVQATVRRYLKLNPSATFEDVKRQFPASLQGSYGVVRTIADIKERIKVYSTENRRWFLDPSDILTDKNGTQFTVTSEWGDNFSNFQKHVKATLGWTLEKV